MEKCMIQCLKKLALWFTKTFKPIMTHEELEPVMATLGFVAQPEKPASNGVVWREYRYVGNSCRSLTSPPPPNARLPSYWINGRHRIDGLHVYTYRAFIDAVKTNLEKDDVSDLFHIRGMPIQQISDWNKKFCRMDGEDSLFVYKEGTLDVATCNRYQIDTNNVKDINTEHSSITIRNKGSNISVGTIVPLKDIIVWSKIVL